MKKNQILTVIIMVLLSSACTQNQSLTTDKTISEIFTNEEINGLQRMLDYTDSIVVSKTKVENIENAYHEYLNLIAKSLKDSSDILNIDEIEKYKFLESIDKSAFNAVFSMEYSIERARYKDTILTNLENIKSLSLNIGGKYIEYLEKLGETDEFFKSLHDQLTNMGDMSASFVTSFPFNHNKIDFNRLEYRLLASVFILRMEENTNDKIERYLNQ
jgi:hypothetical protein